MTKDKKKIKVAYIFNHHFLMGGGEVSLFELIKEINTEAFESVSLLPGNGDLAEKLISKNLKTYITKFPALKQLIVYFEFRAFFALIWILKKEKINLIHVNGSRVCFYAGLAGRILGIPVIWHVRETIKDYFCYDGLLALLASKIICVSHGVKKKRFERFRSWAKKKLIVVYNGVDTDEFARNIIGKKYMRKNLGVDQNITLFGMIGNIIPIKGHDFFLRGFVRAKSMNPNLHVKLLIVGRILDLTYYKKITKFIMENNLSENVIIKDYSPNIKEIFSAIDILSLPSQREGFSRSLIEGMSIGLPVVGTSLDEIKEAVTDKNKALLVEYNNEEKLAVSINKLAQNKKYRVDIGMENRNRAVESFKISDHAKAIENIYKELLN